MDCGLEFEIGINLPLDIKSLLFGFHEEPITSTFNYLILSVKYYIWEKENPGHVTWDFG